MITKKLPQNYGSFFDLQLTAKHAQQETCGNGGADNTGNIGAHGMHEQEVGRIGLLAFLVGNMLIFGLYIKITKDN